ncbi:MAG: hypothetical protein ACR2L9_09740, partial [Solirubrobacteraceae bacterium]
PIPQRRRHQKRLLTITIKKVLGHPRIQLNTPDGTGLRDSLGRYEQPQHGGGALGIGAQYLDRCLLLAVVGVCPLAAAAPGESRPR